jgi:hypothetical protein
MLGQLADAARLKGPFAAVDTVPSKSRLGKWLRRFAAKALTSMGRFHSLLMCSDRGAGRKTFALPRRFALEPLEARQLLDAVAFDVPLTPIEPLGSLAFETSVTGSIDTPGQIDIRTIDLGGVANGGQNDGQSLALVMRSTGDLKGVVSVKGPTGAVLAQATSDAAGQSVVLQRIETTVAGQYTVTLSGAEDTTGDFSVELILNATFEAETVGGPANNSPAAAVTLDNDFLVLDGAGAERAVVVGSLQTNDEDWYRFQLDDGQSTALVLATDSPGGATIELYGLDGASLRPLATGIAVSNAASSIGNFVDDSSNAGSDDYFVRVSGESTDYRLLLTRDLQFDLEPNDRAGDIVQDITAMGLVLGSIDGAAGPAFLSSPTAAEEPDPVGLVDPIEFSVIADYGDKSNAERDVAAMVKGWDPQFIVTLGDNNYGSVGIGDENGWEERVGQFYGEYILGRSDNLYPNQTSPTQRFFPSVGNHDDTLTGSLAGYVDYFVTDPAGERLPTGGGAHEEFKSYYAFEKGNTQFFVIDSVFGGGSLIEQRDWLRQGLAESTAQWKLVVMHYDPYSSGSHGNTSSVQWPYKQWGADIVLAGHDHNYERIEIDGFPYLVNGLGGRPPRLVGTPISGSKLVYDDTNGAMRVTIDGLVARFEFLSLDDGARGANGGRVIDTLTIDKRQLDRYDVEVNAGDSLSVDVTVSPWRSADNPNPLDPAVELIDPTGRVVAMADDGGPGLDARIAHTAEHTGTYSVVVKAAIDTAGEYLLRVEGQTGEAAAFGVRQSLPDNERPLSDPPAHVVVEFDNLVRLDTLEASDLTVDGEPAVTLTVIDGDTAVFTLASEPADGVHEVRIEAGRILDVQGSGIESYTSSFRVDTIPPAVVDVQVGSWRWPSRFLEQISGGQSDPLNALISIPVGSGEQLTTLPWSGIDIVRITLSEDVSVSPWDLALAGVNVTQRFLSGFFYDPVSRSATWTLRDPLGSDKLLLGLNGFVSDEAGNTLDGDWTDGVDVFPSGDGTVGRSAEDVEHFFFRLNVLRGDVDGDGHLTRFDVLETLFAQGVSAGDAGYDPRRDVDADGQIGLSDLRAVVALQGSQLPTREPSFAIGSPVSPAVDQFFTRLGGANSPVPAAATTLTESTEEGVRDRLLRNKRFPTPMRPLVPEVHSHRRRPARRIRVAKTIEFGPLDELAAADRIDRPKALPGERRRAGRR